jgi:EmrB/QacA subfamily drug resistance transporter
MRAPDLATESGRPVLRAQPEPNGSASRGGEGWLLAVCCVAQFMVILDLSIVNVALPSVQSALGFSATALQWVVDAYAIVFAGFLMLGGRVTDHFGQKRTFVAALLLFGSASLVGGAAGSQAMLVAARGFQGLAGALMAATSLAIITSSFPAGPARHKAIALWGAMNGAGGAAGTLLGGVLTQELSWRWVLLINPPVGLAAALVALAVVGERRSANDGARFDFAGAISLTLGLVLLVYGIVSAGNYGWASVAAVAPVLAGIALLAVFALAEARFARDPLVPLRNIDGPLRVANLIVLVFSAALFAMWYVSSLYLQQVLGLSPLETGAAFLPMALTIMVTASQAGKLVGRFGVRAVLSAGLVMLAAGLLLLARIGTSGSAAWYIVLPGVLAAAGIGLSVVTSTILATQGSRPPQAGLASGLVNTSRQVGGALGLALLVSLATQYTSHAVGAGVTVPQALTDGFRLAYLVGAGLVALGALATAALVRANAPRAAKSATHRYRLPAGVGLAVACFAATDFATAGAGATPIGAYTAKGAYNFVSAPGLHPPKITSVGTPDEESLAPGDILVANFYNLTAKPMVGQSGPLVLNNKLQPVWFRPVPEDVVASNLEEQTYESKPVLTWWQGVVSDTGATESGEDVVVNQHYQTVATLKGQNGWVLTLHEMVIDGPDAWVTANKDVPMNLTRYGGAANGVLDDSAVQEYNIATGKLLYSWDALSHVPLSQSESSPPPNGFPWDAYHVNSINLGPGGTLLVSMRNTWAVYLVDEKSGRVDWQLGGKASSFQLPAGASFEWQHDARLHPGGVVTIFDDNCCEITGAGTFLPPAGPSRGLVLRLNTATKKATLLASYSYAKGFAAAYMGDVQLLPNGDVMVGWGSQPYFSEYTSSGKTLLDAKFPYPDLSYRAVVATWAGLPDYPPSGAARERNGSTTVYASWDGATGVASWRVLAGAGPRRLRAVADVAKTGFETAVPVRGHYGALEVQALGRGGQLLGTSKVFSPEG